MAEGLCSRCPNPKLPYHAWCRVCRNAYMREHRPKYRELKPESRKRANALSYANTYQRRGKLVPQPCETCGSPTAKKHHDDFDKPLEIRWLCEGCKPKPSPKILNECVPSRETIHPTM